MSYFITGTDTDVGKTIASCWLMLQSKESVYWKPIQAGQDERDIDKVKEITGLSENRFMASAFDLIAPLSPHEAARRERLSIKLNDISVPHNFKSVIIEGAGGLFVPINDKYFIIDIICQLNIPVILVARTGLGTINHTLMSLKILRLYNVNIAGIILNGDSMPHNRRAIEDYGEVEIIVEIPHFKYITDKKLKDILPEKKLIL